jgi:hypothetical protein
VANTQVTHSAGPDNARSESSLAINPRNEQQMVTASKKFAHPHTYDFTLAAAYSHDGGSTWHDSAPLSQPGFTLLTDPTLAWDDKGNAFLVGLTGNNPPDFDTIGIVIYKSTDAGVTWSEPKPIHNSSSDDKQWVTGDAFTGSPHVGNVYAAWDDSGGVAFARTLDAGATWVGPGQPAGPAGGIVASGGSVYPEINVGSDGTIYLVTIAGHEIRLHTSTDGGNTFQQKPSPATGITPLGGALPSPHGWPVFPGGSFRVITDPTACAVGQTVVVAWADFREGVSRIYMALSNDRGDTWETGPSGSPLLGGGLPGNQQHFHPQIVAAPNGSIGCAFYEFGPKPNQYLIDVLVATSVDHGQTFSRQVLTDQPWDPAVDAPWAHGDQNVTFIGDYMGFDASSAGFRPVWTDTRTGVQELWTDLVPVPKAFSHHRLPEIVMEILFGVTTDGGGVGILGGHIIHIPPWGPPELDIMLGMAIHRLASHVKSREGKAMQKAALGMVSKVAHHASQQHHAAKR